MACVVRCPECVALHQTSRVHKQFASRTCIGWAVHYDEAGVYHSHNRNWTTTEWHCSSGHIFNTRARNRCPAEGCDFPLI